MSPAELLFSVVAKLPGSGVKSLKVVSTSGWLADVRIRSRAKAWCTFSSCEETETDAVESPRDRRSMFGEDGVDGGREDCFTVLWLLAMVSNIAVAKSQIVYLGFTQLCLYLKTIGCRCGMASASS